MKTFLIPLQGLFGMSKGSLHVSHIYVRTAAAVDAALTALFTRTTSRTIDLLWTRRLRLCLQGRQVALLIFELSLVDLTGTTSRDNTDEVFNNNDSNRDCVGYILS